MGKKITVITVCYNCENLIEKTLKNVLGQKYKNLEYIIIDGGSTDLTVEIIKKYEIIAKKENINYKWISEKDKGIYNAMNKGIELATGEFINFMNCGDLFYNSNILKKVSIILEKNFDIIYGDVIVTKDGEKGKLVLAREKKEIWEGILACHQSIFMKTLLLKKYKFDERYKIAADYDTFLKVYLENKNISYLKIPISIYDLNGVSTLNIDELKESEYNNIKIRNSKYRIEIITIFLNIFIKKIKKIRNKLFKYKRRKKIEKEEYEIFL